jgi:hypothetical protein
VNISQVSDNQIVSIWFCCLAMLKNSLPIDEKVLALEEALMTKVLNNNQPLSMVQTGLPLFDESVVAYAVTIEQRLKGLDLAQISTGSSLLDSAFKKQIGSLIDQF